MNMVSLNEYGVFKWIWCLEMNTVFEMNTRPLSRFQFHRGNHDLAWFLLSQFHQKCFRDDEINSNAFIRIQCMISNTFTFMAVNRGAKKQSKVPSFSCPFPVPICIIESTDMKILRTISSNGSIWTRCILVVYPWNLQSLGNQILTEKTSWFLFVTGVIFWKKF